MRGQSFVEPSWNALVKNILDTHSAVKVDMGKLLGKDHFVHVFRAQKNEVPPKGKTTRLQIEPVCAPCNVHMMIRGAFAVPPKIP